MSILPSFRKQLTAFLVGVTLGSLLLAGYVWGRYGDQDAASDLPVVTVYKSPTCGCCEKWVDYLRVNGFTVRIEDLDNIQEVKQQLGVPQQLSSCHTAVVGDYTLEGHVPATDIKRLIREEPTISGLAVPGMPVGSPGMEQADRWDPFDVLAFTREGGVGIYASYRL